MSLTEYKKKRSFSATPEPSGKKVQHSKKRSRPSRSNEEKLIFVVQKHAASHLHYDFRLEMKGVLKSWAVPKGPSMNPQDKRLAMLVEDHPYDYRNFEGIIPKGNYGAGTVMVWDEGTYAPAIENDGEKKEKRAELSVADQQKILLKGFYSGKLSIVLHGKKLKGEFALVSAKGRGENSWLLIKKNDAYSCDTDITQKDKSVVSKRSMEEIAADKRSKEWISNRSADGKPKKNIKSTNEKKTTGRKEKSEISVADFIQEKDYEKIAGDIIDDLRETKGKIQGRGKTFSKKTAMPKTLRPMLATLINDPFDDPDWMYEVKWDGYRALAFIDTNNTELRSRNNNSFNEKFYPVYDALKKWPIKAVVDGEIVVVNDKGHAVFGNLQNWRSEADGELMFYVFDVLWLKGYDLTQLPLIERRGVLRQLVPDEGIIKLSESFEASGTEFFLAAEKLGLEGIIAKKADSTYQPGTRTKQWLKIKTEKRHEAVIAGYTRNEDSRKKFSALILGVYENKELKFIGQAGTGFTDKVQGEILKKLRPLETKKCPFKEVPVINKPSRFRPNPPKADVTWLRPELVCEVRYQELTSDGIMRHPSFQGMREDKDAKDVVKEVPLPKTSLKEDKADSSVLKEKKIITPPKDGERKTFLNPKDETQTRNVNGHELKFTNLSKVYWPREKITKRDMLNYYYKVAPYMLPYMKDRPQSLNRHPNGINGKSFYQKNVSGKVEDWITTHRYKNTSQEGEKTFLVCTDEASLLYIAKLGCIEMNPWHSRVSAPDNPDWCVIDLDPDNNSFEQVIEAANVIKKILDSVDVTSYAKTSGSTGIHIYLPLGAQYSYEQSKQLAELIVTLAHQELANFTSLERNPAKRKGKIYLDYLQNRAIQTIAAPYSLRPKPGATASAPLHWEEVKKGLRTRDFTIFNMPERIKNEGDLFKGVLDKGVDLKKVLNRISSVFGT